MSTRENIRLIARSSLRFGTPENGLSLRIDEHIRVSLGLQVFFKMPHFIDLSPSFCVLLVNAMASLFDNTHASTGRIY